MGHEDAIRIAGDVLTLPSHAASSSRSAGAAATKFLIIRDDVPLSKKRVFGSRG
jgi:hypothetical protein